MRYILICNAGSSTLKFGLHARPGGEKVGRGEFDRIGTPKAVLTYQMFGMRGEEAYNRLRNHRLAIRVLLDLLAAHDVESRMITAIGHRVVYGGAHEHPVRVTPAVERAIWRARDRAPLHNPPVLACMRELRQAFPRTPQIASFDTSFFTALPEVARTYAIDQNIARRYGIRRVGFHGLSHAAAAREAGRRLRRPLRLLKLITLHLGSGCSAAAIHSGKPVDTSMGFSPLEGLVMGTRSGDIDPGALVYLLKQGMSVAELEELLDRRSGICGVSGFSTDMRDVISAAGYPVAGYLGTRRTPAQRRQARLALAMFVYRIRKYLGAYGAVLGHVNAVVFTGAIGEQNADIRRLVMQGLRLPGNPKVIVVQSDEEGTIFQEVKRLLRI